MSNSHLPLYMDQINSTNFIKLANYVYRPYDASIPSWLNDKLKQFPNLIAYKDRCQITKQNGVIYSNGNVDLSKFIDSIPDSGSYLVITRNNDNSINENILLKAKNKKSIKRWYGVNIGFSDPLFVPVPIGCGTEGDYNNDLESIAKEQKTENNDKLVFCRINATGSNDARRIILNKIKNNPIINIIYEQISAEDMYRLIKTHTFNISPEGEGKDCLRTYETIILGGIPICSDCVELRHFENLPIIFCKDWNITEEWCNTALFDLKNKNICTDLMRMSYWTNHINNSIKELL